MFSRITLLCLLLAISQTSIAQGVRIGLVGGLNSTWLFNQNVIDANDELDMASSSGGKIGLEGMFSLNDAIGLTLGVNYSKHNQKFKGVYTENLSYEAKTSLYYLDLPLLIRFTNISGVYFEAGPQFSFLTKNSHDYTGFGTDSIFVDTGYSDKEFASSYNDKNLAIIIGSGVDVPVSDFIYFTLGARFGYGLTDVTKEYNSEQELFDAASSEDQISPLSYWSHFESAGTDGINNNTEFSYRKTTKFFMGIQLGLSYSF